MRHKLGGAEKHLIIGYFNVWVQTSQRNKFSSDFSICGYKSVFEYITRKAPPKRGFSLKRKKLAKRSVLRTAMRVSRSGSFARRIKIGKYGLFGREAATQTRRSRKRHLIIAYFNVWVQTSQRNKLSSDLSICGYKSVFEYITRKAPPKRGFSLKRKKYEKNTNKQYNIRSAVIRGDIFAEGQRNSLLFSVSDDRYGDRVPYLVAVNDRIVIRH